MKASVSARKLALAKLHDLAAVQKLGIRDADKIARRAYAAALLAYRAGNDPISAAIREITSLSSLLADACVLACLKAWKRQVSALNISLSLADDASVSLGESLNLSEEDLENLRKDFAGLSFGPVSSISSMLHKKLTKAMQKIIAEQYHTNRGAAELGKAFTAAGLSPTNSFQMEALFRTQTQLAYASAQWAGNQTDTMKELIWGYTYVTVGDDRVRPEHAALDGITASKEDPIWDRIWTPNGWACRCQIVEVYSPETVKLPPPVAKIDGKEVVPGPSKGFDFFPGVIHSKQGAVQKAANAVLTSNIKEKTAVVDAGSLRGLQISGTRKYIKITGGTGLPPKTSPLKDEKVAIEKLLVAKADGLLLTRDQELAVVRWTRMGYSKIRYAQRNGGVDKDGTSWTKEIEELEGAVAAMPKYSGTLYRGVPIPREDVLNSLSSGGTIEEKAFASFSTSPNVAYSFGNVILEVRGVKDSGVRLGTYSAIAKEKEVLMPKGFKYRPLAVVDVDKGAEIPLGDWAKYTEKKREAGQTAGQYRVICEQVFE
jgi:SPP1 gp7 family putative phage head morphogenesis protein